MAQFPALKRMEIDDREPDNGVTTIIAPNGRPFGQSLYDNLWYVFQPVFVNMTEAEALNLEVFEEANRIIAFDFHYKVRSLTTLVYECFFINPGVKVFWRQTNLSAQAYFRGRLTGTIPV